LENVIVIDNLDGILAGNTGIRAIVENRNVNLGNVAGIAILNGGEIGGSLTQSGEIDQANVILNVIAIENSGGITNPGTADIFAAVTNLNVGLANEAFVAPANIAGPGLGHLSQIAEIEQANVLETEIVVNNDGSIVAVQAALLATISNVQVQLENTNAAILEQNLFALEIGGSLIQPTQVDQANAWLNTVAVQNDAIVSAIDFGIYASVGNRHLRTTPTLPP
jgi:hypothetical protein